MDARVIQREDASRYCPRMTCLLDKRRELRALVRHEHRDQFGGLAVARIRRYQMRRAGRFEERLANLEGLDRTAGKLRADFAFGDVSGDGAGMAMRAGKSAGPVEHPLDTVEPITSHALPNVPGKRVTIGSTVSSADPVGSPTAHSGSTIVDMVSIMAGSAFP